MGEESLKGKIRNKLQKSVYTNVKCESYLLLDLMTYCISHTHSVTCLQKMSLLIICSPVTVQTSICFISSLWNMHPPGTVHLAPVSQAYYSLYIQSFMYLCSRNLQNRNAISENQQTWITGSLDSDLPPRSWIALGMNGWGIACRAKPHWDFCMSWRLYFCVVKE